MRPVTACLICGRSAFQELVRFGSDWYFQRIPCLATQPLRYVVCRSCGFVCQSPTLDNTELQQLYAENYRPEPPSARYVDDQQQYATLLYQWIMNRAGGRVPRRRVLEIGCAAGFWLAEFQRHGWETVGVDANGHWTEWGRTHLGLDLRTDFYGSETLPGEKFSLIVFSHILEHLPDPLPALAAIRENLDDAGYLFLGVPDVLRPPPAREIYPRLMAGPHVCLYSPRTVTRLLERVGFRVAWLDHWMPRGMRVLATPAPDRPMGDQVEGENWRVIRQLYAGLLRPPIADRLARNLAALVPRHAYLPGLVSRKGLFDNYRLIMDRGCLVNLECTTGRRGWRLLEQPPQETPRTEQSDNYLNGPPNRLIIQVGLGLGDRALAITPHLERTDQRLLVCEPDPAIAMAAFMARDLTSLLTSDRVYLGVGSQVMLNTSIQQWIQDARDFLVTQDPQSHQHWHGRYDSIVDYFKAGRWRKPGVRAWKFRLAA